jgi:hypothetical protein
MDKIREEVFNRFRKRVEDQVKQHGRIAPRPIVIEPYPAGGPLRGKGRHRRAGTRSTLPANGHPERRN